MEGDQIKVPNLVEMMKSFKLKVNPNYKELVEDSEKFIKKFGGKYSKKTLSEDRALFYAMTCPSASIESLCLHADLINALWFFDEVNDEDVKKSVEYGKVILEILDNLDMEVDFHIGEAAKDALKRMKASTSPNNFKILCKFAKVLVSSQIEETIRREKGEILNVENFIKERIKTAGSQAYMMSCIVAERISLLENELFENENFNAVFESCLHMVGMSNDIYSYFVEQELNTHDANLIGVLMNDRNISLQEAFDEAGRMFQKLVDSFLENKSKLTENESAFKVVEFLETSIRGFVEWHTISKRYTTAKKL